MVLYLLLITKVIWKLYKYLMESGGDVDVHYDKKKKRKNF